MTAFVLVIPIILIRYGLLALYSRDALSRAAFFPQRLGVEQAVYWVYQLSGILFLLLLSFYRIQVGSPFFSPGVVTYCFGAVLYALSMANFAQPVTSGVSCRGLYRFSRNPMYVAFFLLLLGCVLITRSALLLALLLVFQLSSHWIILSEERWCLATFGDEYRQYMNKVRRYL